MYTLIAIIAFAIIAIVVAGIHTACKRPERMFERYDHHGNSVWVRKDLKGRHRDHCLCFSCKRFHPGSTGNCSIAKMLYSLCIDRNLVTPVWECPAFAQDPFA